MNIETIKNFISNTVFKSKKIDNGVLKALATVADDEEQNGYNVFNSIKELARDTPNEVYNNILPLHIKTGKKAAADVLFDFISKSDTRLALTGVYSDKERGLYCATDAKYMAIAPMPDAVKNTLEKSIIKDKNGNEITAVYPNYFNVIPQKLSNSIKLDSLYLYAGFVGSLCNFNACFFDDPNYTAVEIDGVKFQPDLLLNMLNAFCKCGCISATMQYNTPEYPVMFTAANGLQVIAMPLRKQNNGGYSFSVHARVNILTDDARLHNFCLDHRKIFAGGNEFFGTYKNPLYGVKFEISQAEINKLDQNIKSDYINIISRIAAGAVNRVYDAKLKDIHGMNISGYLKECDYTVASEHTAFEHKWFADKVKSIKTPNDCKSALPLIFEWMQNINDYVSRLVNSGYKSEYSGGIASFNIEYYEKAIFEACQKNIADEKITLEYAESLFQGGRERYNAIAELTNNAQIELEKREKEMQAAIPADSGIYITQQKSNGKTELYYQHEKTGWNLYKTIEELLSEKQAIELQDQERKQAENNNKSCIVIDSGFTADKEKAEFERLQAEKAKMHGYSDNLDGIKKYRAVNFLAEITPYINAELKGKTRREIVEMYLLNGYTPEEYNYVDGKTYYRYKKYITINGITAASCQAIDSKIEYDYAVYLHENKIIQPDNIKQDTADAENKQDTAVASDQTPLPDKDIQPEQTAVKPPKNANSDDVDKLPYWDKARELCIVSSGTLANLLNCDKYSVIERVEYEWQEYIARNGTTADNWQKCWQEFQQSEEYNYLALLYSLPLPLPDERKPDISGSSGNDCPDNASGIASNADAELPPDDTMPPNACTRAYEHTDCHCKPSMQASYYMRMHTGKHTDCPPDKSNVAISCTQAGIHTDQHRQRCGIASVAVPAAVPDG